MRAIMGGWLSVWCVCVCVYLCVCVCIWIERFFFSSFGYIFSSVSLATDVLPHKSSSFLCSGKIPVLFQMMDREIVIVLAVITSDVSLQTVSRCDHHRRHHQTKKKNSKVIFPYESTRKWKMMVLSSSLQLLLKMLLMMIVMVRRRFMIRRGRRSWSRSWRRSKIRINWISPSLH